MKRKAISIVLVVALLVLVACTLIACDDNENPEQCYVTIHLNNGQDDIYWKVDDPIPSITNEGYEIAGIYLEEDFIHVTTLEALRATGISKNIDVYVKWIKVKDGDNGDGGNTGNGGNTGDGGNTGNGGNTGDGGNTGNGGNTGDGGNTGNGGNTGDGGNTDNGGNTGDGGNTGNGGNGGTNYPGMNDIIDGIQDVEFGSSNYQKPMRGDFTKRDLYDIIQYAISMYYVACGEFSSIEEAKTYFESDFIGFDEFAEDETYQMIFDIIQESGLTHSDAMFIMGKMGANETLVIEAIKVFFNDDGDYDDFVDTVVDFCTNPEKVGPILQLAKDIMSLIDVDTALAVLDATCDAIDEDSYYGDVRLYNDTVLLLSYYDSEGFGYDELLKEVADSEYLDELMAFVEQDSALSMSKMARIVEARALASGALRVVDALLSYDVEELTSAAKIVFDLTYGLIEGDMNVADIFSSKSDISLKEIIGAVNTAGGIVNTILDECEEDPAFIPAVMKILQVVANNLNFNRGTNLSLNGVWQIARMAANLLEKITFADISEFYADYDDVMKATDETKRIEKAGYFYARIAQYINDEYAKLGAAAKAFVFDLLNSFGVSIDRSAVAKLDEMIAYCNSKDLEDFTNEELRSIVTSYLQFENDDNSYDFMNTLYATAFVPVGASKSSVLRAIADNHSTINSLLTSNLVKEVTCDTTKAGYTTVTIDANNPYGDAVRYRGTIFVYDSTSSNRFVVGKSELFSRSSVYCVGINKDASVDDAFYDGSVNEESVRAQLYSMFDYYGLSLNDTKACISIDLHDAVNAEDIKITGVDSSKAGWGLGMITFDLDYIESVEIPFAYYVVDHADPQVTDFELWYYNGSYGSTFGGSELWTTDTLDGIKEDLWLDVEYDHCREEREESLDDLIIIGLDLSTEGYKTLTVSYCGIEREYEYCVRDPEKYYNPDNWFVDDVDAYTSNWRSEKMIDGIPHFELGFGDYIRADFRLKYENIKGYYEYLYVYPECTGHPQSSIFTEMGMTAILDFDYTRGSTEDYTDCYLIITKANGEVWHREFVGRYKFLEGYDDVSNFKFSGSSGYDYVEPYWSYYYNGDKKVFRVYTDQSYVHWDVYMEMSDGNRVNIEGNDEELTYISGYSKEIVKCFLDFECDFNPANAEVGVETPCYLTMKDKSGNVLDSILLFYYTAYEEY